MKDHGPRLILFEPAPRELDIAYLRYGPIPHHMRWLLIAFLLGPLHSMAEKLIVVVYTIDAKEVVYRCRPVVCTDGQRGSYAQRGLVMQTYTVSGRVMWHAVGGVPPYKEIVNRVDKDGVVTVTVMDAAGNVGSGAGMIARQVQEVSVDCRTEFATENTRVTYGPDRARTPERCAVPSTKSTRSVSTGDRTVKTDMRKTGTGAPSPPPPVPPLPSRTGTKFSNR